MQSSYNVYPVMTGPIILPKGFELSLPQLPAETAKQLREGTYDISQIKVPKTQRNEELINEAKQKKTSSLSAIELGAIAVAVAALLFLYLKKRK